MVNPTNILDATLKIKIETNGDQTITKRFVEQTKRRLLRGNFLRGLK